MNGKSLRHSEVAATTEESDLVERKSKARSFRHYSFGGRQRFSGVVSRRGGFLRMTLSLDFRHLAVFMVVIGSLLFEVPRIYAETGLLPKAHELFAPLRADPRELQYALRFIEPVSHKLLGEAAMGDYLGLYRWALPWESSHVQVSGGGGVFGLFDLSGSTNDTEDIDFYGNLPLDIRAGKWSGRFMYYHTSSHLGDDFIRRTGLLADKHSWDNLRWILSYDHCACLRLYGGYTYAFRTLPQGLGRNALQAGFEAYSNRWANGHAQTYWANDLQSWQRVQWNPAFNSQLGIKVVRDQQEGRALSFFVEFFAGHQPQGQFFLQQETHWVLGIKFDLS